MTVLLSNHNFHFNKFFINRLRKIKQINLIQGNLLKTNKYSQSVPFSILVINWFEQFQKIHKNPWEFLSLRCLIRNVLEIHREFITLILQPMYKSQAFGILEDSTKFK